MRLVATRHFVMNQAYAIVDRALDVSGGAGAFKRNPPEQIFRDVRMGRFHPGNTPLAHNRSASSVSASAPMHHSDGASF